MDCAYKGYAGNGVALASALSSCKKKNEKWDRGVIANPVINKPPRSWKLDYTRAEGLEVEERGTSDDEPLKTGGEFRQADANKSLASTIALHVTVDIATSQM